MTNKSKEIEYGKRFAGVLFVRSSGLAQGIPNRTNGYHSFLDQNRYYN